MLAISTLRVVEAGAMDMTIPQRRKAITRGVMEGVPQRHIVMTIDPMICADTAMGGSITQGRDAWNPARTCKTVNTVLNPTRIRSRVPMSGRAEEAILARFSRLMIAGWMIA